MPTHKHTQTDSKQIKDNKINLIKIWLSIAKWNRDKRYKGAVRMDGSWQTEMLGRQDIGYDRSEATHNFGHITHIHTCTHANPAFRLSPLHSFHSTFSRLTFDRLNAYSVSHLNAENHQHHIFGWKECGWVVKWHSITTLLALTAFNFESSFLTLIINFRTNH